MDFHKRLRRFRKDLDLSYQAIADACEVKWQTVQQWCADDGSYPKIENLEPLARLLKTTPWYLLFGVEIGANSSNSGQDTPLSDEASELVERIIEIQKRSPEAAASLAQNFSQLAAMFLARDSLAKLLLDPADEEAHDLLTRVREPGGTHAATERKRRKS
jgi:transcriptional regulator with XRE-family HTH domain